MRMGLAAILLGLIAVAASAAEKVTERTWKLAAGEKSPPATLADMKWLTGHWVGEAFGGRAEELWAAPAGPNMFYELMAVTEVEGSLVFRLKHFNADLTGWEEKNEVRSFPLVAKKDGAMHFEGMSFHPDGDKLTVYLAVEHDDKSIEEVRFTYLRAPK
jgi:Domain of unknown function (DUF6265)